MNTNLQDHPTWLKVKECGVITTRDSNGDVNGELVDILNRHDSVMSDRIDEKFQQYYMSTVKKGMFKGFHAHPFKLDALHVVHGVMVLVLYPKEIPEEEVGTTRINRESLIFVEMGRGYERTVMFPSKYPHGFFGVENAVIINYRNPAWEPTDTHQYDIRFDPIVKILKERYSNNEE